MKSRRKKGRSNMYRNHLTWRRLVIMERNMQLNHGEGRGIIFGWLSTLLAPSNWIGKPHGHTWPMDG